jgi:hypothetical protein
MSTVPADRELDAYADELHQYVLAEADLEGDESLRSPVFTRMSMPAPWFILANWANETDNLNVWDRQFAFSIGRRIGTGTSVTPKQAVQARRILEAATGRGFGYSTSDV